MAVPSTHARRGLIAFLSALALAVVGLSTVGRTQGAPQTPAPPATGGAPQGAAGAQGERGAAGAQGGERGGGNRGAAPGGRAGGPGLADAANVGGDYGPKPPVTAMSPEEEAKRFILPPGYHLELVLSDPDIVSPAAMAFDGNGRLYVAEFSAATCSTSTPAVSTSRRAASACTRAPSATASSIDTPSLPTTCSSRAWCCRSTRASSRTRRIPTTC